MSYSEFFEQIRCGLHYSEVTIAAHYNSYKWFHEAKKGKKCFTQRRKEILYQENLFAPLHIPGVFA
jgi:hypothetical protein